MEFLKCIPNSEKNNIKDYTWDNYKNINVMYAGVVIHKKLSKYGYHPILYPPKFTNYINALNALKMINGGPFAELLKTVDTRPLINHMLTETTQKIYTLQEIDYLLTSKYIVK
jgi:hypothetical protein